MVTFSQSRPNTMEVAAAFGFSILCIAQFIGPLSGGHINCAVSLALFIGGRISFLRLCCYTLCQMLGSVIGAVVLLMIFGKNWPGATSLASNSWDEEVFTGGQVFLAEMFGTMLLVYAVLSTLDQPSKSNNLGPFPIAMSVMVSMIFLLPIDGCSINPTRSFGPSTVAAMAGIPGVYRTQQYMFWFAPLFGAFVASIIYHKSVVIVMKPGADEEEQGIGIHLGRDATVVDDDYKNIR